MMDPESINSPTYCQVQGSESCTKKRGRGKIRCRGKKNKKTSQAEGRILRTQDSVVICTSMNLRMHPHDPHAGWGLGKGERAGGSRGYPMAAGVGMHGTLGTPDPLASLQSVGDPEGETWKDRRSCHSHFDWDSC